MTTPRQLRLELARRGYEPLPLIGKRPVLDGWQKRGEVSPGDLDLWSKLYPNACNTGILTRTTPTLDLDITDPAAAEAAEVLTRERFEEIGDIHVRFGKSPKRAVFFRTTEPFRKIVANFVAPNGEPQKIEFLADGQQVVVDGIHPDTAQPYMWHGGALSEAPQESLPYIRETEAHELVDVLAEMLVREFGYRAVSKHSRSRANGPTPDVGGGEDWQLLLSNIIEGHALHDSLRNLAAKLIRSGMSAGATVNHLRSLIDASSTPHDQRWQERRAEIPRLVDGAAAKYRQPPENEIAPPPEQDTTAAAPRQIDSDPVDLWGNFEPPTLPRGLLPELIEKYAFAQGETMGVDPGGVAMAALAVCAGAIPDSIELIMKRHTRDWTESARLWVGLVGLPSTKKSPIISATIKPLTKLDAELLRNFLFEMKLYEQMEKEERKHAGKPVQKRLRLEDTTIEGAQEVLGGSPNGVLLVQDELSGFFGSMDKYSGHRGAAKDRGFWLQSYNGGQYALNRVGRGAGIIPNLSVSLLGGIQPDVIRRLSSESYDDGFLQRILLIVMRPAGIGKDVSMPTVSKEYAGLIERLTALRLPVSGSNSDDNDGVLRFDNLAQETRNRLEAEHLKLMQIEAINRKLAAHIGKYDGLFGRLCVAFHCIKHAFDSFIPEFVTEETAERVAKFMRRFLLPHATAFYSGVLKLADDHDRLAAIAGYILARQSQRITNRDVQRGDRTMRKLTRHDTDSAFEQLEALGWLTRTAGPRLTDPPHWIVNPVVHQRFAARAKEERERREATVILLKGLS